jgi:hypothetical protein
MKTKVDLADIVDSSYAERAVKQLGSAAR